MHVASFEYITGHGSFGVILLGAYLVSALALSNKLVFVAASGIKQ